MDELEIGDKVYYHINNQNMIFCVSEIKEVEEKDLSVLDNTQDTKLTLITCITGKHDKRYILECDLLQNNIDK